MWDKTYIVARMMMDQFRRDVEAYLSETGMAPSRFGRNILNDPGFVYRLRNGGECRPSTIDKIRKEIGAVNIVTSSEEVTQ